MICGEWLENNGISDLVGDFDRALGTARDVALWNRQADVLENAFGVILA